MSLAGRTHHRLLGAAATAAAVGLGGLLAPAATAAVAPVIDVRPGVLDRGADPAIAYVDENRIIEGSTRVRVRGRHLSLLGARDDGYIVAVQRRGSWRVVFAPPGGEPFLLVRRAAPWDTVVSADGRWLGHTRTSVSGHSTRVRVVDTDDAGVVADQTFRGRRTALDVDRARVILGSDGRTVTWRHRAGGTRVLTRTRGYVADIAADRLATYTGDPYAGGCTTVRALSAPRRVAWRSCGQRVTSFGPGGRRMTTIDKLSDGLGPRRLQLRRDDGQRVATYRLRGQAWLDLEGWESPTTPLLDAHGATFSALVRCRGTSCERASDLQRSGAPR